MNNYSNMSFRLNLSSIVNLPARDSLLKIKLAEKITISDLKVIDLILENDEPTINCSGIYTFYSQNNECLYVGKTESCFIERIPWHFALHESAWMNHFLKYLRRDLQNIKTLEEAALKALNCKLLLLPIDNGKWNLIKPLEKFFRIFLIPKFNTYSESYRNKYANLNLSESIENLLQFMK